MVAKVRIIIKIHRKKYKKDKKIALYAKKASPDSNKCIIEKTLKVSWANHGNHEKVEIRNLGN